MNIQSTPLLAALSSLILPAAASITSVSETNLGGDAAAVIATGFGEDALTFSDRTHQHNGAAFEADLLNTAGTTIIDLPDYLVGNDYVSFANNARDNVNYEATIQTDVVSEFYLLVDNRINGPAGNNSSPNTSDPDLGGTLQWVIDGGWERVNTGISPNGQGDYTGVDEGGDAGWSRTGSQSILFRLQTSWHLRPSHCQQQWARWKQHDLARRGSRSRCQRSHRLLCCRSFGHFRRRLSIP
jgi:hypothetical protein